MHYFAYGSNMSINRLRQRVPSAKFVTIADPDVGRHKAEMDIYLTAENQVIQKEL